MKYVGKPRAKRTLLQERELREEQFDALTDFAELVSKSNRVSQIDTLDGYVIDQWETDGGK